MTRAETLARHSGVTERTARRWIASGRTDARKPWSRDETARRMDRVVQDLREQGPMRTVQVATRHGVTVRTARRWLRALWVAGRVRPVGSWDWEAVP